MASEIIDQRVRLTRKLLKDALVQLMQTQSISEISVRALCDVAGINRSTFYAHFKGPEDLLHHIEQEVMNNLKSDLEQQDFQGNRPLSLQVLIRILEYLKSNADMFKVLFSENCDIDFQNDIMGLAQVVTFKMDSRYDARDQEYVRIYGIAGCISLIRHWLQDGLVETPEKMAELILKLVYHGMVGFE